MNVILLIFGGCLCALAVTADDSGHVLVKRSGITFRPASPSSRPNSPSVRRTSGKDAIGQEAHGTLHDGGTVSSGYVAKGKNAWQSPGREGQDNSLNNPAESHTKYKDDPPQKEKKKGFFGGSSSKNKGKKKGRK